MTTGFPSAPLATGYKGAGAGTVEKPLSVSHTEIQTLPGTSVPFFASAPAMRALLRV